MILRWEWSLQPRSGAIAHCVSEEWGLGLGGKGPPQFPSAEGEEAEERIALWTPAFIFPRSSTAPMSWQGSG